VLWIRVARAIPRSYDTPGIVDAIANATPSKVLWLSFRTTTFHGAPMPEPVPRSTRSLVAGLTDES
jgi:hypothetical protein